LDNGIHPGAFLTPGRAFGDIPAWAPRDGLQRNIRASTALEIDCNDSKNNSDEETLDLVAVIVETADLEREVMQRIRKSAQLAIVKTSDASEIYSIDGMLYWRG
jgi:hypothetical protein